MLLELGNLFTFGTYVPPQDGNKLYVNKPLATFSSVKPCPTFTFEDTVKFAKTVDVIWFNERSLPHAFFEVEHSTDIYNSLRKFVNLRDFYASFVIVAHAVRRAEFDNKRTESAYAPIARRVRFLDYETLTSGRINPQSLGAS